MNLYLIQIITGQTGIDSTSTSIRIVPTSIEKYINIKFLIHENLELAKICRSLHAQLELQVVKL